MDELDKAMLSFWENIFERGTEGGSSTARKAMARADDPFKRPVSISQEQWAQWASSGVPQVMSFYSTPRSRQKADARKAAQRVFPFEDAQKVGPLRASLERGRQCETQLPRNLAEAFALFSGLSSNEAQASYRATALDAIWRRSSPWVNLGRVDARLALDFLESPVAWGTLLQAPAAKTETLRGRALRLPLSWLEDIGGDAENQARHCARWAWGLSQATTLGCGHGWALRAQSVELFIHVVRQCDVRFQECMQHWKESIETLNSAQKSGSSAERDSAENQSLQRWHSLNEQYAWIAVPMLILANDPKMAWGRNSRNGPEIMELSDPGLRDWSKKRMQWLLNEAAPEEWLIDRMERASWLQSSPVVAQSSVQEICRHWVRRFETSAQADAARWHTWDTLCAKWIDEMERHWRDVPVEDRWLSEPTQEVLQWVRMGLRNQAKMPQSRLLLEKMFPLSKRETIGRLDPVILQALEAGWEREDLRSSLEHEPPKKTSKAALDRVDGHVNEEQSGNRAQQSAPTEPRKKTGRRL